MFLVVTRRLAALSSEFRFDRRSRALAFHRRDTSLERLSRPLSARRPSTRRSAERFSSSSRAYRRPIRTFVIPRDVTLPRTAASSVSATQVNPGERCNGRFHVDARNATRGLRDSTLREKRLVRARLRPVNVARNDVRNR